MMKRNFTLFTMVAAWLLWMQPVNAQYTKILDFTGATGQYPGSDPENTNLLSDGTYLYGMTASGGQYGMGTIFKIKISDGSYTILHELNGTQGASPYGSLVSDGNYLYGMTQQGGAFNLGIIFKINILTNSFEVMQIFNGANGASPTGSLTIDGDYLYGMTRNGGASGFGTTFKLGITDNSYTNIHNFNINEGYFPEGSLISDGTNLYGVAIYGGVINTQGTIFKIKIDEGSLSVMYEFDGFDGSYPRGSLITDGTYLYGMTESGGVISQGTIFKINKDDNSLTNLYEFDDPNGSKPNASLVSDGSYLYGMTPLGGTANQGTIFKLNLANNIYTRLYDFTGTDGTQPKGSLVIQGDNLYGMTSIGGAGNFGVLFKYQYEGALPITVQKFSGSLRGGIAHLTWKTGIESDINNIDIQTSTDGKTFNTIAHIATKGNNSKYAYEIDQAQASVFYRLKIVHYNGSSKNSAVLLLTQNTPDKLSIYPNPAKDYINIQSTTAGKINIYDSGGRLVRRFDLQAGVNSIDISYLPTGVYSAVLNGIKLRFIKQ